MTNKRVTPRTPDKLFTNEHEFRAWFDQNMEAFGVKRIIVSQEVCPDYVLEMTDGRIARVEAELFAVNFRYHGHDPAKVDFILACYSKTDEIDGVPVVAAYKLHIWNPEPAAPVSADSPLSEVERGILDALLFTGGLAVSALAEGKLAGDHTIWLRFAPDKVASFPRGKDDSIMTVMPPEAKKFIKKYHHALIAAGLSADACDAINTLLARGLAKYRPLALIASLMDGGMVNHPAWIPTELYPTPAARKRYKARLFRG
jgi:hypothetical protein